MSTTKSKSMDMINGPLIKNILIFSVPLMLSNLLQIAFNATDTIVVGRFSGSDALAAVGNASSSINLIVSLMSGISVGVNIDIARNIGHGNKERIPEHVGTSFFLAIVGGILITIMGLVFAKPLLNWMNTPSSIINDSAIYMQVYFLGSIPMFIYNVCSAVIRADGDTVKPTIYLVVSGALNLLLNILFIIVFKMGVVGVALATVLSQTIAAILIVYELLTTNKTIKLQLSLIKFNLQTIIEILRIGIPTAIQSAMYSITNMAIQYALNSFDSSTILAGNTAAANVESFVYIGIDALSMSATTFTSQNVGAGRKDNVKKIMWTVSVLMIFVAVPICVLLNIFGEQVLYLYNEDSAVIASGMVRIQYVTTWLFINGVLEVPSGSIRGMGRGTLPTVIMFFGVVVIRVVYIFTIFSSIGTLESLYFCYPLSWVITTIIMYLFWGRVYNKFEVKKI